jgi:hypothetical protein
MCAHMFVQVCQEELALCGVVWPGQTVDAKRGIHDRGRFPHSTRTAAVCCAHIEDVDAKPDGFLVEQGQFTKFASDEALNSLAALQAVVAKHLPQLPPSLDMDFGRPHISVFQLGHGQVSFTVQELSQEFLDIANDALELLEPDLKLARARGTTEEILPKILASKCTFLFRSSCI